MWSVAAGNVPGRERVSRESYVQYLTRMVDEGHLFASSDGQGAVPMSDDESETS